MLTICQNAGNRMGEAVMLRGLVDVTTWITEDRDGDAMARHYAEAVRLLEMFTELRHEQGMSDAAVMCSWSLTATRKYSDAVTAATEALRLAEQSDHLGGEVRAELALALAHFEQRQLGVAIRHADNALIRARVLGNARSEATALQFAGIGHREVGDFDTSQRMLDESLGISRKYRDAYTEGLTLLALARLHVRRGDFDARKVAETALALSREYNMSHHTAEALEILGGIELASGNPGLAIPHLKESVALWGTRGWHSFHATALTSLGKAYADIDPLAARKAFTDAYALFVQLGDTPKAAELKQLLESSTGS